MFLHLKQVFSSEEVQAARQLLGEQAPWVDGRHSAGSQALGAKQNLQLAQDSDVSRQLQAQVRAALARNALFFSAALPKRIFNPLFNRYDPSASHYGAHVDGAVLHSHHPAQWVRSDISCTLFLSAPDEYEGGELLIQGALGEQRVKLPAGDMILYPSSTVHQVTPVTRGARIASFFWVESMVRSTEQRQLLFDMDMALLQLRAHSGEAAPGLVALTGTYHNLLRMWADV